MKATGIDPFRSNGPLTGSGSGSSGSFQPPFSGSSFPSFASGGFGDGLSVGLSAGAAPPASRTTSPTPARISGLQRSFFPSTWSGKRYSRRQPEQRARIDTAALLGLGGQFHGGDAAVILPGAGGER